MNEQQKQAVEAVIKWEVGKQYPLDFGMTGQQKLNAFNLRAAFEDGLRSVLNNLEKYGLQPINEWNKDTPPFDGLFLCFVVKKNECGTFSKYQKVVECSKNKWVVLDNERVARWMYLPNEPQREIGFADMPKPVINEREEYHE